jgi:hypothetical protein
MSACPFRRFSYAPGARNRGGIRPVFWAHASPAVVFAGSRYGYLYRSDDGGESWTKLWREFSEISSVIWVPG